jgi:peptide/nickel transport system substrate-binding protein
MVSRSLRDLSQSAFEGLQRRATRRQMMRGAAALGVAGVATRGLPTSVMAQDEEPAGKIVISLAAEPASLEPWYAYSTIGLAPLRNVFEALLNRDPETNELVGELATSWEWQDDRTLQFTLREGVTFHDGSPLDAEAAAASLNWIWSADNAFDIIQFMGPQITAEAVDEMTINVMTAEPDPILPNRLYFSPLGSAKQIAEAPDSIVDTPIGTGPYRFVAWNRGQNLELTAYEDWWGKTAEDARGTQAIKDVEYVWRDESAVRASQVNAGEAQLARFLTPEDCETTAVCAKAPSIETPFLRMDTMHLAMSDRRVREAIGLAVDKEELATALFGGADVATQMVGPSAAGFNPDLTALPYDMERARALVEEARADGVPVDAPITVAVRRGAYPRVEEMGEYVAQQLVQVGLNAKVEIIEPAAYEEQFTIGYDNITPERGWIGTNSHGNEMMDVGQTASGYYRCAGGVSTFCDEEVDAMVNAASPLTGDERAAAFMEVTAAFMEHIPVVPLVHLPNYYGMAENLQWTPRLDGFMLVKEMSYAE